LRYAQDSETVELLIQYGADVNGRDENNSTPTALHFFAAIGNTESAKVIIDHGADLGAKNNHGLTPLHSAAQEGRLDAAKLLVSRGADINARSRGNKTPFDHAARPVWDEDWYRLRRERVGRCKEVAAFLLSRGSSHTIFDLAWLGDLKQVDGFIREDASLVNAKANGEPLLFSAIRGGNSNIVDYLLKHGAQLKVTGRFRQSPLQLAAYMGYADIARVLLGHGADVNERGPWGETALHWAAVRGNTDVAAILLKSRADTDSQTLGQTVDLHVQKATHPSTQQPTGTMQTSSNCSLAVEPK
jgi:ankyrin repeat protein